MNHPRHAGLVTLCLLMLLSCSADTKDAVESPLSLHTAESGRSDDSAQDSGSVPPDRDRDGYDETVDCMDYNNTTYPGAPESCNGRDDDCDGMIDEGAVETVPYYLDADRDSFGDPDVSTTECNPDGHWVRSKADCDDTDPQVNPNGIEVCDGTDQDCDDEVDEGGPWYTDADGDRYGDPDTEVSICESAGSYVTNSWDCDDTDPDINPGGVEDCDGQDEDCDYVVDDGGPWYADADADGYGDASTSVEACDGTATYIEDDSDCDDTDPARSPAGTETCDGVDENCDGVVDDGGPWYTDADGDGYGDPSTGLAACTGPSDLIANDDDCDDADDALSPDALESCDGRDENCDGEADDHLTCATCEESGLSFTAVVPDDHDTIQDAIDASSSGDAICVRGGVWYESLDFGGRDLLVYGEAGAGGTILDASGLGTPVVRFATLESADATLQGFTLRGGTGELEIDKAGASDADYMSGGPPTYTTLWCGAGVYVSAASPTLKDLVLDRLEVPAYAIESGTEADTGLGAMFQEFGIGAGLCFRASGATLERVDARGGSAFEGGVAYVDLDSVITWEGGEWRENEASVGGAIYNDEGVVELSNIVSVQNDGYGGMIYNNYATLVATNISSYADGPTAGRASAVYAYHTDLTLRNSIFSTMDASSSVVWIYLGTYDLSYNLVYAPSGTPWDIHDYVEVEPTGSNGNLSEDPLFKDASDDDDSTNDDLRLATGSPAIDAGDPDSTYDDTDGTRADMGAFGGPGGDWADGE